MEIKKILGKKEEEQLRRNLHILTRIRYGRLVSMT